MHASLFDRSSLKILPLSDREHDLTIAAVLELTAAPMMESMGDIAEVSRRVIQAKQSSSAVILMMGAHVLRSGVQRYIIDLMEQGYISCLAMNGAGVIHDFEFSLIGATTESVSRYIATGQFGLWKETGFINDIINEAWEKNPESGLGEAVGRAILEGDYPWKETSVLANALRFDVPVTVHVAIGYDIIHEHPNCSGAATGALSYNDFLKFAAVVQRLENGVVMNFGSAVMGPEVFLKALSMARNIAHQEGQVIRNFTTVVCDLYELPDDFRDEPSKNNPGYYFRPWKTMLVRTVAEGGESYYIKGQHAETIPALWTAITEHEKR
jgi:hypothetical protein